MTIKLDQPAFYMLLGGSAEFAELPQAYIGHAESFKERVKSHKSPSAHGKQFWDKALVFVAGDNTLTKVDVAYIEANLLRKLSFSIISQHQRIRLNQCLRVCRLTFV